MDDKTNRRTSLPRAQRGGRRRTVLVAVLLSAAACRAERPAAPIQPPPGMDSVPIANHVLYIPTGFHINIFANANGPRFMALAPDGSVYVSQFGAGSIARFVDADHDGVAESSSIVRNNLLLPHGVAF